MRQNLVIGLLSVACTLLAVNLYVSLSGARYPAALGQGAMEATGSVAIAAVHEPWIFVYDVVNQRLACYKNSNQGIEFKGLRQLTWDLRLEELPPAWASKGKITVSEVRKQLEKVGGGKEQPK